VKWLLLTVLLLGCTASQRDWRQNTYIDVSAGGDTARPEDSFISSGINYPVVGELWGTVGAWSSMYGEWGPYWGLSYAWAPFN